MTSSLPARGGRGGGARATEGWRATEVSRQQATQAAERATRREGRTAAARQASHPAATREAAGPMGREVEQAPGAGPRISAGELGGRSVTSRPSVRDTEASTNRSTSGDQPQGGRAERMRAALRTRSALRQAILIREVLGPPAAFQTGHRDVPGLPGH
ncbi:MAG: hypothetical protein WD638_10780 [Nitriliruptoraceae bacterium]